MPKIVFLGTNGWYDSETGSTVSILVKTEQYDIVLDAGYAENKAKETFENSCMTTDGMILDL